MRTALKTINAEGPENAEPGPWFLFSAPSAFSAFNLIAR